MRSNGYELMQVINAYSEHNTLVLAAVHDEPFAVSVVGIRTFAIGQFVWYKRGAVLERAVFVNSEEELHG